MLRVIIIFFSSLISLGSNSQTSLNKDVIDTINLQDFHSDKVVSYKYNTVTFFLKYNDFKSDIIKFATDYKNDQPVKYPRPSYRIYKASKKKSLKVLNNIIDELNSQINSDTVFLIHHPLDERTLWRWQLNDIIISQIEKNNCAIIDANGNKQFTIVRVNSAWSSTPMTGRGGRRYYFYGDNNYFIDRMDWIQ